MHSYVLGIDIGTTQTKCVVIDGKGTILASAVEAYPTIHNGTNYAEQDANEWWNSLVAAVRTAVGSLDDLKYVRAVSISSQGGSVVPLSENFEPLALARVWTDARCENERAAFARYPGADYVHMKTGWALSESLMALQIANIRNEMPEVFAKTKRYLSVPDYIAWKLTGRAAIDNTSIGIVQLGDIHAEKWDSRLLETAGIDENKLAEIVESGTLIGRLTPEAAEILGLTTETQVFAGGHDQYCVALGSGAIHSGDAFVATGTAWTITGISNVPDTRFSFGRHVVKDLWGSIIALSSGGVCMEWLRNRMLPEEIRDYDRLNFNASQVKAGSEGLMFYPNLYGAQYPENRKDVHGAFTGLSFCHGTPHMIRSVMEGVCFHVAWAAEAFNISPYSPMNMVGGASKSDVWSQMLADVMGKSICIPAFPDVGCVGATLIAGVGIGLFDGYENGIECIRRRSGMKEVKPSTDSARYREIFEKYKRNYAMISQIMEHD